MTKWIQDKYRDEYPVADEVFIAERRKSPVLDCNGNPYEHIKQPVGFILKPRRKDGLRM